jgi:hypothetical protein
MTERNRRCGKPFKEHSGFDRSYAAFYSRRRFLLPASLTTALCLHTSCMQSVQLLAVFLLTFLQLLSAIMGLVVCSSSFQPTSVTSCCIQCYGILLSSLWYVSTPLVPQYLYLLVSFYCNLQNSTEFIVSDYAHPPSQMHSLTAQF